jgi:hypothetical protein
MTQGGTSTRFVQRFSALQMEVAALKRALEPPDPVEIGVRCMHVVRDTHSLLDTNVTVLFSEGTVEARQDLDALLGYAERQIAGALSEEHEEAVILARLSVALSLASIVLGRMDEAIEELRRRDML